MTDVDVVVVSYNSSTHLRACLEPIAGSPHVTVVVVDNASADDSIATIEDLPVQTVAQQFNGGFAQGCNRGWRLGHAPYVLLLNPDARIDLHSIEVLARTLDENDDVGIVGPQLRNEDGSLALSLHRFLRVRTTFSEALYLHHLWPLRPWSSETVWDPAAYEYAHDVEWLSGACLLVRRKLLDRVGGLDETFFMYGEDLELCRTAWASGLRVRFEPDAVAWHAGGASAPRPSLLPRLAESRLLCVTRTSSRAGVLAHRAGFATESITHALLTKGGWPARLGYLQALRIAVTPRRRTPNRQAEDDAHPHAI
jgi:GT2 family glycosyltransferase